MRCRRCCLSDGPIELSWSTDRYRLASRADVVHPEDDANAGHGESNTAHVGIATAAIRSSLFWCYTSMLDTIAFLLLMLMGWSEDCPCHYKPPGQEESIYHYYYEPPLPL